MNSKKKKSLEESYERIIKVGFCIIPYEDLSDIIGPNPMVFGTTKDEKIFSFEGVDALFKSQFEQMGSMEPDLNRKRLATQISADENNAFIVEEITLTLSSNEEVNTIFMRASCVMEYIDSQWKLTHWHASTPVDTENDHWHMEEWKREKEKLQKLVDQQTADLHLKNRELEIEASMERIRAQATAMKESSDLLDIVVTMRTEFVKLGHEAHYFWHMRWLPEKYEKAMTSGDGSRIGMVMTLPRHIHGDIEPVADWEKSDEPTYILAMDADIAVDYVDKMISLGDFEQVDPQAPSLDDVRQIGGLTFIMARTTHGEIGFSLPGVVPDPPKDAINTLVRFAGVFDLAYKRFEDLKAAERQHREAQIELALERVRARTMAMQKSEELADVAFVLFEQFRGLGGKLWGTGFGLCKENADKDEFWFANENGVFPPVSIPNTEDPAHKQMYEGWKSKTELLALEGSGEDLKNHYEYMLTLPEVRPFFQKILDEGLSFPEWQQWNAAYFTHGYLLIITLEPNPDQEVLKRFARVFDQTYTRFLDLQKAEEQAREAKIETALEKVRSRTMGMQSSDELPEVANLLFLEVQALDIPAWSCGYCILEEDRKSSICIMSSEGTLQKPFLLPHHGEISFEEWDGFVQGDQTFFTQELGGKAIESHYGFMKSLPQLTPIFQEIEEAGLSLPTYQINHLCKFGHGFLLFITYEPVPEAHDIFKRFTRVFDQIYTRFLDLKNAEARTKESQIELSLERIRSQVTAMQESSDLFDIVVKMRSEFISLGHEADYFWHMRWLPDVYEMSMTSEDGHRLGMVINIPKFVHYQIPGLAEWEKGNDPFYVLALDVDDAWDYIENMNTHGHYEKVDPNAPTRDDIEHIGGLTFIIARTSHGEIGYSLPGVVPEPPKDALDTLVRFAGVFDLAYKRFEDLKTAEKDLIEIKAAREKAEKALIELKATQDQLVQQEKLASLGQLTAGIAHEIKNPLNFVNNFSDVSIEMIDEALEELRQIGENEHAIETAAILDDIKSNLSKIHEHGSRADSIVKSMLQHSRGGDGKMEQTPINPLIKEYVNLAFHGMRAGKEPINVDIELDLDESIGDVPLIAEDFSRVILNLCNNAFDAMRDKLSALSSQPSAYQAILTVRTFQKDKSVTIEIEDNGPGIPEKIKDNILQPFFTTKKGTQGTGLGLSITNDIVKAHGGSMDIHSKPGQTVFTIKLIG